MDELRCVLQPVTRSPIELAELQPEWRSYDALLSQEVTYVKFVRSSLSWRAIILVYWQRSFNPLLLPLEIKSPNRI